MSKTLAKSPVFSEPAFRSSGPSTSDADPKSQANRAHPACQSLVWAADLEAEHEAWGFKVPERPHHRPVPHKRDRAAPKVTAPPPPPPAANTPKPLPAAFAPLPKAQPLPKSDAAPAPKAQRARATNATSFLLCVLLPALIVATYLYAIALPQYASTVGFSVRSEDPPTALDFLGGLGDISSSASSDSDILFDYARSPAMVEAVKKQVNLPLIWQAPGDPVFGLAAAPSKEDLHRHWGRKVRVWYDPGTQLITIRALAFDPASARAITTAAYDEGARMINALSDQARRDATAHAQREFDQAQDDLRDARLAVTEFRTRTQIVDPSADMAGRLGVVASLQEQLAQGLIELGTIDAAGRSNRQFLRQETADRITIIEGLIASERAALTSQTAGDGQSYADVMSEFERLAVDLRFAQDAYVSARAALELAQTDAQRTTRYLAAHIPPTLAENPQHPRRAMLLLLFTGALILIWAISTIVITATRDRR